LPSFCHNHAFHLGKFIPSKYLSWQKDALWSLSTELACVHAQEILPDEPLPASEFELKGTRYDGQIAVLGKTLHEKLTNLKYFLASALRSAYDGLVTYLLWHAPVPQFVTRMRL
jgi:hypothetical protein